MTRDMGTSLIMMIIFRDEDGYKTVEPGLDQHNVTKKNIFEAFFTVQEEDWENGKDEAGEVITVTRPVSYCKNIRGFLKFILEDRSIDGTKVKIGLDKGLKSLKYTCSLISPYTPDQTQDFLLAVVHFVEETYKNVLKILTLCQIDVTPWDYFCSDMKMTMIVLGKKSFL